VDAVHDRREENFLLLLCGRMSAPWNVAPIFFYAPNDPAFGTQDGDNMSGDVEMSLPIRASRNSFIVE